MKKKSHLGFMFASLGIMLGFSSCKKCVECSTNSSSYSYDQILCKPEHYTAKAWNETVDNYEDNGYDCDPL